MSALPSFSASYWTRSSHLVCASFAIGLRRIPYSSSGRPRERRSGSSLARPQKQRRRQNCAAAAVPSQCRDGLHGQTTGPPRTILVASAPRRSADTARGAESSRLSSAEPARSPPARPVPGEEAAGRHRREKCDLDFHEFWRRCADELTARAGLSAAHKPRHGAHGAAAPPLRPPPRHRRVQRRAHAPQRARTRSAGCRSMTAARRRGSSTSRARRGTS